MKAYLTKWFLIIHLRKRRRIPVDMTDFLPLFAPPLVPGYSRPIYRSSLQAPVICSVCWSRTL